MLNAHYYFTRRRDGDGNRCDKLSPDSGAGRNSAFSSMFLPFCHAHAAPSRFRERGSRAVNVVPVIVSRGKLHCGDDASTKLHSRPSVKMESRRDRPLNTHRLDDINLENIASIVRHARHIYRVNDSDVVYLVKSSSKSNFFAFLVNFQRTVFFARSHWAGQS